MNEQDTFAGKPSQNEIDLGPTKLERLEDFMKIEKLDDFTVMRLGAKAEGSIEAGADQKERLEEFTIDMINGHFHVETSGVIPCGCIDGRDTKDGQSPKPDSAGGSESLYVAAHMIGHYGGINTEEGYRTVLEKITSLGLPVGGHSDDHAEGLFSGCGANDKLSLIYDFIVREPAYLQQTADALGVKISDETIKRIVTYVSHHLERTEFSSGASLRDALDEYDGDTVDVLSGPHREVVAVINTKYGTTLDRLALRQKYGDDYQAFNIDVWTFEKTAEIMTDNPRDKEDFIASLVMYNLATAHVLCGPNMRVVTL